MCIRDRTYRDFRNDNLLDTRQFQMAFRRLRQFSSQMDGPKTGFNVEKSIAKTCDEGGLLNQMCIRDRALIAKVFHIEESDIQDIQCLKAGMTNKSFLFTVDGSHYICRIPGPGTGFLINRAEEKASYEAVSPLGIADRIIYFDGETGYKISRFYDGARNLDPKNWDEAVSYTHLGQAIL